MSQKNQRRPVQAVLELPESDEAKKKIETLILQWQAQLSEEISRSKQRSEMISRLNIRLEMAEVLLKSGRCHVHKLQSVKAAADHVVVNAISYLRQLLKPYQMRPAIA